MIHLSYPEHRRGRRAALLGVVLGLVTLSSSAVGEPIRVVDHPRVRLRDLSTALAALPAPLPEVDLGPSPPPGGSRLFARESVLAELRTQGLEPKGVNLPPVVRVQRAARHIEPSELKALLEPQLLAALGPNMKLASFDIKKGLLTVPNPEVGPVRLPQFSRREGPIQLTVVADLLHDGNVVARLPVPIVIELSAAALQPSVAKGARVDLVIERGNARISAAATALEAAELGQVIAFKVSTTSRVLRARITSPTSALVVSP
ncbi:MAG TPA: flagella basal body P-ring formation protein FlgA [Polyangiaceae bacterium]|nr:flagella basal body P-ring formation protein FlgA [Polyangiaceae bacterium]